MERTSPELSAEKPHVMAINFNFKVSFGQEKTALTQC